MTSTYVGQDERGGTGGPFKVRQIVDGDADGTPDVYDKMIGTLEYLVYVPRREGKVVPAAV